MAHQHSCFSCLAIAASARHTETCSLLILTFHFSGDHDISIPWIATLGWIESLGVSVFDAWRAWYHDGQIAGYQVKFMNDHFRLTYVTVKGAGHTAPEYKPKESLAMIDRYLARYPI
ncbi:hypothetical protein SAY87_001306 [Trapa incisa]|uniref:Uncharacterized protein n=1 Tax=Trapa incisa TaxID=236973 RepID=A0AAN7JHJ5_9MYRT|nr:hypothetical protein SAY87_001306 [Trapa incisa]